MNNVLRTNAFVLGAALLLTAWGSTTYAQETRTDEQRARFHYEAGTSYFAQRRFLEAAAQFRDSYRLSNHLELLLNIATSFERGGDFGRAADALDEWLQAAPEDVPDRRTQETRRDQARARHTAEQATSDPPQEPVTSVSPDPVSVDPVSVDPVAPESGLATGGKVGVGLLGVALAMAAVSVGTGVAASAQQDRLETECTADRVCASELQDTRDRGQTLARTSTAFTFLAAASAGAGIVMLLMDLLGEDNSDGERTLRSTPGPGDVGVGVQLQF